MKKIVLLLLIISSIGAFSQRTAMNYLIQQGGGNGARWTKTLNTTDSVVDLTVAGKSLTEWLAARTSWASGDKIWIAAGTYTVATYYNIGSSPSLSGSFPSAIYGGFVGTESTVADRVVGSKSWEYTNETVLNGATSTNGIFGAGSDRSMVIDGITFSNCGNTNGQAVYQRPGMTIQNCKFSANACVSVRYYISSASKTANLLNSYFYNNTYTTSGGAEAACVMINNASSGGTYTVSGCVFDSNSSTGSGSGASAGIKAQGAGNNVISACIFKNNNATAGNSSAVSLTSTTSVLKNSLIYGTSVATNKPAIYVTAGTVLNNTVVNNLGSGIYLSNTTSATAISVVNTVFWGSDSKSGSVGAISGCLGTLTNCAYTGLSANFSGTSVNSVDLTTTTTGLFSNADNNDWTLPATSVLVDMGTTSGAPDTDLLGIARPQQGGIDIGAYEYRLTSGVKDTYANKVLTVKENQISSSAAGMISVYDITGKLRMSAHVAAGGTITLAKGMYIVKLISGSTTETIKVLN